MAALLDRRHQPRLGQPRQMAARRLRRDAGHRGELGRGQRPAVQQAVHHRRPRRIADECRDLGKSGLAGHPHALRSVRSTSIGQT